MYDKYTIISLGLANSHNGFLARVSRRSPFHTDFEFVLIFHFKVYKSNLKPQFVA
jgi:hypothetical protein